MSSNAALPPGHMRVRIAGSKAHASTCPRACNTYHGRVVMVVVVSASCPTCGGPRAGEPLVQGGPAGPQPFAFECDGEPMEVDRWRNGCGHVDLHGDVQREAGRLAARAELQVVTQRMIDLTDIPRCEASVVSAR